LNYVGKFDATLSSDGLGAHSPAYFHVDHVPAHAPANAILVPDAQLLFHGDFKRSGVDLILSNDDREFVLHDYFKGEKRAALASPDGAHLTGDLINALTGEVQVSQAGGAVVDHQVIGHVTKLQGSATAIRNGVSIILNMGDNVEKGDVVQSGSDSTLGVTFIDGTVFGLSSNARMVLNEMVYDPNGSNNSSLLSLVAGTITFVAGETAKHGDMKIDTPVATMGIRGTAVLVEIDFTVPGQGATPDAKFQVLVEPDGTTGSYILFDKITLQPIAMVNTAGQQINISNGVISQSSTPLSPDIQKLITDVFSLKFSDANTNTKTTTAQTDTLNPDLFGPTFKLASGAAATPVFLVVNPSSGNGPASSNPNGGLSLQHIPGPPIVAVLDASGEPTTGFGVTELVGKTGDAADQDIVVGKVNFADVNAGDKPTVKAEFSSFTYQNAQHQDATAKLNALQLADIAKTAIKLVVVPDSGNNNNGNATLTYSMPDKAFDFLAAGETLTLTYLVRVDNNYAPSDEATQIPITITITGTNDAPAITTSAQTINFSGGTNVPGGDLTSSDPTSGTMTFTDVDLTDTHTVSTALTSAVLSGGSIPPLPLKLFEDALSASISADSTGTGTGTVNWKLADLPVYLADFIPNGQTLALTYTITVTDSQGATSTQTVTVDITGTNNPAVVWIHTTGDGSPDGLWSTAQNWETGTVPTATDDVIIITDQMIGLTPVYPVTIDLPALAKSVTMNDFGTLFTNSPTLINQSTLTVGSGGISLSADSIIENDKSATVSVAGLMGVLDQSSLQNYGQITLQGGGDFRDQSKITNFASGTIEVSGGTLNVLVDVANSGLIRVDAGAAMALDAGTIDGGTVTINGTLELQGGAVLKNGSLGNFGQGNVSGTGNALDNENVTANHVLEIQAGAALTIDLGSKIANSGGAMTVESTALLTLNHATVTSGTVTNDANGTIDLTGTAVLQNVSLGNFGQINVSGTGNELDAVTVALNNALEVLSGSLTIDQGSTVANSSGSVTVGGTATLTLNDATVTDGIVTNKAGGTIGFTGTAVLNGGSLGNSGLVKVSGTGNTLDGETVTNKDAGAIHITGALTLKHATSITNGASNAETVESTGSLTLQDTSYISGGTVSIAGTLDLEGTSFLQNGILTNAGQVKVSGTGNTLVGDTVTNNDAGAIDIIGALTLKDVANITNGTSNTETVESAGSLTLQDTSYISGGKLTNLGTVKVEASTGATLDNVAITGAGTVQVDTTTQSTPATLNLDGGTSMTGGNLSIGKFGTVVVQAGTGGSSVTFDGVKVSDGNAIDIGGNSAGVSLILDDGTTISNGELSVGSAGVGATLEIAYGSNGPGATLDGVQVTNHDTIQVDGAVAATDTTPLIPATTLTLDDGAKIFGGALALGSRAILDVEAGQNSHGPNGATLDNVSVSGDGTIEVGLSGATTLTLTDGANTNDVAVTIGNHSTLDLDGSTINGGLLTNSGMLDSTGTSIIDGATIVNSGSIEITSGTLTIDPTPVTNTGTILVTDDSTLVLNGETVTNSVTDPHTLAVTNGTIQVDATDATDVSTLDLESSTIDGGIVKISGVLESTGASLIDKATINNSGTIDVTGGTLTIDAASGLTNTGTLEADGGTLFIKGDVSGAGAATVTDGGTLDFGGADAQTVTFDGAGTLKLEASANFTGTISALATGDVIDLAGTVVMAAYFDGSTLLVNGQPTSFQISSVPAGDTIAFKTDGSGGTDLKVLPQVLAVGSPPPVTGVEGSAIQLDFSETVTGASLSKFVISGIPDGAVVSDGTPGHSYTSVSTDGSVDVASWNLSSLTITPANDANFTLSAIATAVDSNDFDYTLPATEVVTVNPSAPTVSPVAESRTEGKPIALDLGATVNGLSGDSNTLASLMVSAIPVGATLSDGHDHSFTATSGSTSVDVSGWTYTSLSVTPANDANFTLGVAATEKDANGDLSATTTKTETVTVTPEAPTVSPVAESGTEGKPIALDLGVTVNGLSGDSNTLASLVVSAIPVGATLKDDQGHTFTAKSGSGVQHVDVHSWDLSALTITLAHETNFTLDVAATERDANGDLSATSTGAEAVTVYGHPTILGETNPATQTIILDESPVVLAAGGSTNSLGFPTETFDEVSPGSLSNNGLGHGNFTNSDLHATFSSSGDAGVVNGSSSVSAAPFIGPLPGSVDATNYLSIGAHGTETITFASEQNEFGLYWGSVDPSNTIDFYNGTKLVASYTGADISPLLASGGQGSFSSNGYVEFSDLVPFNKVVLSNGNSNAFEIDNISAGSISDSHIHLAAPITGTLAVSDDDIGDPLTASVIGDAVVKYNGSTSLPSGINVDALINPNAVTFDSVKADGDADVLHWTYNPTNPDLDFLEPGDTLTITFNAQVSDGHATAGNQPLTITLVGTGASVVNGTAQNDTFVHVGGGATIFGNGGNDTFVFNPNFGSATIGDFDVRNDTIDIDRTLFSNVAAILASAQPANFGHDTIITDAAHDKIVLTGVTVTQLNAHQNDFHLV
jgi:fibronectin-binding autotransporter adhesin